MDGVYKKFIYKKWNIKVYLGIFSIVVNL